jgi:hypothetical protein
VFVPAVCAKAAAAIKAYILQQSYLAWDQAHPKK